MDARIVAFFLFLCLSTGYSMKNDDVDDDILDMLQENPDNMNEAKEMVSCDPSLTFSCCFAFRQLSIPSMHKIKSYAAVIIVKSKTNYFDVRLKTMHLLKTSK